MSRHSVVLCEGYHDRAFWSGWLTARGWESLKPPQGTTILDPLGRPVKAGRFAFRSGGNFAILEPCGGWARVSQVFSVHLGSTKMPEDSGQIDHLIPCFDDDIAGKDHAASIRNRFQEVTYFKPPQDCSWTHAGIRVDILHFRATSTSFGPRLDGLVAECYGRAHPDRAQSVEAWISNLPSAPQKTDKQTMWAIMAGWYAAKGCEAFLQESIWSDEKMRQELERALEELGIAAVAAAMEA
ncbi:MAG: hypothetical protein JNM84_07225 [Planctomycetes bacterium]|nr:hypothetical protein [Planctomycetota bacterium]